MTTDADRTDDPTRWFRRGALGFAIVGGWVFIAASNHFHITAPVVFVCLGYLAILAVIINFWKIGAMAAAPANAGEEAWTRPVGPRDDLEKEKKTLLKAIKEAEFDLEMGKLSKRDADEMIATYRARAIAVIKELDKASPGANDTREKIEREVKARLAVEAEAKKRPKTKAAKAKAKEAT
jgi:hypothetical protein